MKKLLIASVALFLLASCAVKKARKTTESVNDSNTIEQVADTAAKPLSAETSVPSADQTPAAEEESAPEEVKEVKEVKPLTFKTFVTLNRQPYGDKVQNVAYFHKDSKLEANLKELGFTCTNRRVEKGISEVDNTPYSCLLADYNNGSTSIKIECGLITIKFPSADEKNIFIDSVKEVGYRYNKEFQVYGPTDADPIYCTFVEVNGNEVRIDGGAE